MNAKWLLIAVFLAGCTVIYITGDGNTIDTDWSGTDVRTDTDIEAKDK